MRTARSLPYRGSLSRGSLSKEVSVQGGLSPGGSLSRGVSVQGCLCSVGLCPRRSLSRGFFLQGALCPGGVYVQGVSVQGTLCPGVSVWGSLSRGSLSRGLSVQGSLSGGLCPGVFLSGRPLGRNIWLETEAPTLRNEHGITDKDPPVDRKHLWKHYLVATSFAGSN